MPNRVFRCLVHVLLFTVYDDLGSNPLIYHIKLHTLFELCAIYDIGLVKVSLQLAKWTYLWFINNSKRMFFSATPNRCLVRHVLQTLRCVNIAAYHRGQCWFYSSRGLAPVIKLGVVSHICELDIGFLFSRSQPPPALAVKLHAQCSFVGPPSSEWQWVIWTAQGSFWQCRANDSGFPCFEMWASASPGT